MGFMQCHTVRSGPKQINIIIIDESSALLCHYVVLPLWIFAGFSLIHFLQFALFSLIYSMYLIFQLTIKGFTSQRWSETYLAMYCLGFLKTLRGWACPKINCLINNVYICICSIDHNQFMHGSEICIMHRSIIFSMTSALDTSVLHEHDVHKVIFISQKCLKWCVWVWVSETLQRWCRILL